MSPHPLETLQFLVAQTPLSPENRAHGFKFLTDKYRDNICYSDQHARFPGTSHSEASLLGYRLEALDTGSDELSDDYIGFKQSKSRAIRKFPIATVTKKCFSCDLLFRPFLTQVESGASHGEIFPWAAPNHSQKQLHPHLLRMVRELKSRLVKEVEALILRQEDSFSSNKSSPSPQPVPLLPEPAAVYGRAMEPSFALLRRK